MRNRETWLKDWPRSCGFAKEMWRRGRRSEWRIERFGDADWSHATGRDLDAGLNERRRSPTSCAEGVVVQVLLGLDEIWSSETDDGAIGPTRWRFVSRGQWLPNCRIAVVPGSSTASRWRGYWDLATNWFADGDLGRVAWPVGPGVRQAIDLAMSTAQSRAYWGPTPSHRKRPRRLPCGGRPGAPPPQNRRASARNPWRSSVSVAVCPAR